MLQGYAFARAVRGHLLVQTALSNIVLDNIEITDEEQASATEIVPSIWDEPPSIEGLNENPFVLSLSKKIGEALTRLCGNGKTAKLWVQYFQMVNLMKEYIPYFHSSGHFPYAKSCHHIFRI